MRRVVIIAWPAPDAAVKLGGTVRANSEESMTRLRRRVEETLAGAAAAHGCTAEVRLGGAGNASCSPGAQVHSEEGRSCMDCNSRAQPCAPTVCSCGPPPAAQVDWMQDQLPYYPPTVNNQETYKFAMGVASR